MPDKPNGQLNYRDRRYIEDEIRMGTSFSSMAKHIGVCASTVVREVQRNRNPESTSIMYQTTRNVCIEKEAYRMLDLCKKGCLQYCKTCKHGLCNQLCPEFKENTCPKLDKPPYVCNTCHERWGGRAAGSDTASTMRSSPTKRPEGSNRKQEGG